MHIAGIPRSLVPNYPGQYSAFGFIMTDARVDRHRTVQQTSKFFDQDRATRAMSELVAGAIEELKAHGYVDRIEIYRSIEARYLGQNHELELTFPGDGFNDATAADLWKRFHEEHQARFGFSIPGETIETVNLKVIAVSIGEKPKLRELPSGQEAPEPWGRREVCYQDGFVEVPVYRRVHLKRGHTIAGPVVVEEEASVTVVRPGQQLTVDGFGNLLISA
jgi:N-methylhydantoinase A